MSASRIAARVNVGSNRLLSLAADIRAAHENIRRNAAELAEQAIAAGLALIEAKATLSHGEWGAWLAENVRISQRTASRYMRLARSGFKSATVADLGLRAAEELLASLTPPITWPMPKSGEALSIEIGAFGHADFGVWANIWPCHEREGYFDFLAILCPAEVISGGRPLTSFGVPVFAEWAFKEGRRHQPTAQCRIEIRQVDAADLVALHDQLVTTDAAAQP